MRRLQMRRLPGRAPVRAAAPALALLVPLALGCASAPPRPTPPRPGPAPAAGSPPPPAASVPPPSAPAAEETPEPAAVPPWEIPPALLASQRLYRVRYDGPQGEGGLRLTLWLADAERYRARAADLLGRPLWSLSAGADGGLWVDHRAGVYCRLRDAGELVASAGLPLAPFPLAALPPLLLGRLPAAPAGAATVGEEVDYRDADGRRWTAALEGAAPTRWALWKDDAAGGPVLTWLATGGEAVLSDRAAGIQLRWREVVAEPLAALPAPSEPPADYRQVSCRDAAANSP